MCTRVCDSSWLFRVDMLLVLRTENENECIALPSSLLGRVKMYLVFGLALINRIFRRMNMTADVLICNSPANTHSPLARRSLSFAQFGRQMWMMAGVLSCISRPHTHTVLVKSNRINSFNHHLFSLQSAVLPGVSLRFSLFTFIPNEYAGVWFRFTFSGWYAVGAVNQKQYYACDQMRTNFDVRNLPGVWLGFDRSCLSPNEYDGWCSRLHFSGEYSNGLGPSLLTFCSGLTPNVYDGWCSRLHFSGE